MSVYEYKKEVLTVERGSETIYGELYIPIVDGKRPTVIMSHGYNSSCSDVSYAAGLLAESGIVVYCYDFVGGSLRSKSSGTSEKMSIATEQADLCAVIDAVLQLAFVDGGRLYLYGESQGGFVSAMTGVQRQKSVAGLFLIYPAFCIPDDWRNKTKDDFTNPVDFMGMRLSEVFLDGLPKFDVFDYVRTFEKPVHIFHGDADRIVSLSYSERLAKCFPKASLEIIKGGHGFGKKDTNYIGARIARYINE